LVIIPAKAIPIYSYEEGIEKLNTAPLAEIDRLAEEFAMGDFDVSKGVNRELFYKLLSKKIYEIPDNKNLFELAVINPIAGTNLNDLKKIILKDISLPEHLTTLYATRSLLLDSPETFKKKYQKFIKSWLYTRRTMLEIGSIGLLELANFQTVSIYLNKEAITSPLFIETVYRFKDNSRVNHGQIWDEVMDTTIVTNLRAIDKVDPNLPKMQEEIIRNHLVIRVNELKNNPREQYFYLKRKLSTIVRGQYQFSFKGLDNWFDIIWANTKDQNIKDQVNLLVTFFRSRQNWELKVTTFEFMDRTLRLIGNCDTADCKIAKSEVLAALSGIKMGQGKFDEAEKLIKESKKLISSATPDIPESPLLLLSSQFREQTIQGKFGEADQTLKKIRSLLADKNNFPYITPEMYYSTILVFGIDGIRFDLQMGRYGEAKKYIDEYLQYIQDYSGRDAYLKSTYLEIKTKLLSLLGKAEIGLGNFEKGKGLISYAEDYDGGGNNLSFLALETRFWNAFFAKDFELAYDLILKAQKIYLTNSNAVGLIPLDVITKIIELEISLAKAHLSRSDIDEPTLRQFIETASINFESLYFITSNKVPIDLLGNLALSWSNYSLIGDTKYAAFYAKRYVNLLQELRSNIKAGDNSSLGSFTAIYKDNLQKMSNTFFAANDYDSASKTLNIIKENELLDFSNNELRSGVIETYLTYTKEEQDFFQKVKPIQRELARLENLYQKVAKKNNTNEAKRIGVMYNANLKQIQNALVALRKGIDITPNVVRFTPIVKGKDFAVIQTMITRDQATFNISSQSFNEQVSIQIPRDKLRLLVYQAYGRLSSPTQEWRNEVDFLNTQVFSLLIAKINSLGIKNIYFVPDDALTFLPPDFIFNTQVNKFSVINLVSAKAMPVIRGSARMGVDAFAATKGGVNFSPLPSARDEATFLSSYKFAKLKADSVQRAFIDSNFTKSTLKDSLSSSREIIHIASHFKASGNNDKDVGLLLGDGTFLSLQDLFADGKTYSGVSLLTLSACETGVSLANLSTQAKTFDGLAGLFAKKGVSQVLATLWKISDASTADFMKVFYIFKESEGLGTQMALERAKLLFSGKNTKEIQLLSSKYPDIFSPAFITKISKYSHPFYWAGFVLVSSGT
jgi:CHAT domain-containing protein